MIYTHKSILPLSVCSGQDRDSPVLAKIFRNRWSRALIPCCPSSWSPSRLATSTRTEEAEREGHSHSCQLSESWSKKIRRLTLTNAHATQTQQSYWMYSSTDCSHRPIRHVPAYTRYFSGGEDTISATWTLLDACMECCNNTNCEGTCATLKAFLRLVRAHHDHAPLYQKLSGFCVRSISNRNVITIFLVIPSNNRQCLQCRWNIHTHCRVSNVFK